VSHLLDTNAWKWLASGDKLKLAAHGLKTEDPADQLIVAAAMIHRLTLVTRDRLISKWDGVPVLNY
jgi:PIN domain nuclease of toxin-antitoxin system